MTEAVPFQSAMILAAGLGTRMRPVSEELPKPLVPVRGRPLIDYALDRLTDAGVERIIVNAHYRADMLIAHLTARDGPQVVISDERAALLDTGGGIAHALPLLGEAPFYAVNSDVIWLDGVSNSLHRLATRWNPDEMDALLLVHLSPRAVGYTGRGDFMMDPAGSLRRRKEREDAPYIYTGIQILHPRLFAECPAGAFSLNLLYDRALAANRLYGLCHDGLWLHVGTPDGLRAAETSLAAL